MIEGRKKLLHTRTTGTWPWTTIFRMSMLKPSKISEWVYRSSCSRELFFASKEADGSCTFFHKICLSRAAIDCTKRMVFAQPFY
jgi:hypothetical protein